MGQAVSMADMRQEVTSCSRCPLAGGRTQTVFGIGNEHARVLIIGEAPGKNEDLQGEPFVGAAGKYLNELLALAGLTREDVYIANVLKCRPPSNRNPRVEEIEACTPFLRMQTKLINPEYIVTLGNFATKFILKTEVGITRLHGTLQKAGRFKVFPVFHPAAALYDGSKRIALDDDFTQLGKLLHGNEENDEAMKGSAPDSSDVKNAASFAGSEGTYGDSATSKQSCSCEAEDFANGADGFDPVDYLYDERWSQQRLGLERIEALLDKLGRPQDVLNFVHVAGTNGKGSTCSYLASILHQAGYKTGLFTSPSVMCFEERIMIDGCMIDLPSLTMITRVVADAADEVKAELGEHPTCFELITAVAFVFYARMSCDIVVLEVGLGGRYDSTNVIRFPEVCAIAPISLDHTAILGNDIASIASEKAGVIKRGAAVVYAPQEQTAQDVICAAARDAGTNAIGVRADRIFAEPLKIEVGKSGRSEAVRVFSYDGIEGLRTKLLACYQPQNAALAIEAARALRRRGWTISDGAIARGIAETVLPGRFEIVAEEPWVIIDGGHNLQGAKALSASLRELVPEGNIVFVIGILADKDYSSMIAHLLDQAGAFVTHTPNSNRALRADALAATAAEIVEAVGSSIPVAPAQDLDHAVQEAFSLANRLHSSTICMFGSLYAVADAKAAVRAYLNQLEERG